jgi:ABC-type transporter Mla subunit MlaD
MLRLAAVDHQIRSVGASRREHAVEHRCALSDLLDVQAKNLKGQGAQLRQTIHDLGLFTGTLSDNKDELFASLTQIDTFVHALRTNDGAVRAFNGSMQYPISVQVERRADLDSLPTPSNSAGTP